MILSDLSFKPQRAAFNASCCALIVEGMCLDYAPDVTQAEASDACEQLRDRYDIDQKAYFVGQTVREKVFPLFVFIQINQSANEWAPSENARARRRRCIGEQCCILLQ